MAAENRSERKSVAGEELDWLERDLECIVCMELNPLKILPCQHLCCLKCLDDLKGRQSPESVACPTCGEDLSKKPEDYQTCRWAEHFQKSLPAMRQQLLNGMHRMDIANDAPTPKQSLNDLTSVVEEGETALETWKRQKSDEIDGLQRQREKLADDLKKAAAQLSDAPTNNMVHVANKVVPELDRLNKRLQKVARSILSEQSLLGFIRRVTDRVKGHQIVLIVEELDLYEQCLTRKLGESIQFNLDSECYDVKVAANGHVLVATDSGLLVLDPTTGSPMKTIEPTLLAGSVEVSGQRVFVSFRERGSRATTMYIYDADYTQIAQWSAVVQDVTDIAVVDEKMCVSHSSSSDVVVYNTLTGKKEFTIIRNSRPDGVASCGPGAIFIGDKLYNTVHKYLVGANWKIEWSVTVSKPWGMVAEEGGTAWVASQENKSLTLISRSGRILQEIVDDRLSKLEEISGLCVKDDTLWIGHEKGVTKFQIIIE